MDGVSLANAPCSYGVFEVTVGAAQGMPEPEQVVDSIAASGYAGTDLGPLGWLGGREDLTRRLSSRGLALAGGYLEMPFSRPELMEGALSQLDELLDIFDAVVADSIQTFPPRPTLADGGSSVRKENPGRAHSDRSLGLDSEAWRLLASGVTRALRRCQDRGFEPTFHHHVGSHVEAAWEIEELLELTEISLCLDTGHLLIGGSDPVEALRKWANRINHVHIKDCRIEAIDRIVQEGAPLMAVWSRHAFCRLGTGNLDVIGALRAIEDSSYSGWLVVEQDGLLDETFSFEQAVMDQAANREFLRSHGL